MHKWIMLESVLSLGFNMLMLDVDVVVSADVMTIPPPPHPPGLTARRPVGHQPLRNPFGYLADLPACDLLATVDYMRWGDTCNGTNPNRWAFPLQRHNTAYINTGGSGPPPPFMSNITPIIFQV